jgi:GT2 family glycosyltransferase
MTPHHYERRDTAHYQKQTERTLPGMKSCVIIPVHNRKAVTLRCLRCLHTNRLPEDTGIIVVDDGSKDGTAEAVTTGFPDIKLISGNGELYWTGGIRAGMQYALEMNAEYLFWLNDDCLPEPECFSVMQDFLHKNPRSIGGAICFLEGASEPIRTGFQYRSAVPPSLSTLTDVHGLSGFCVGMPSQVCREIGLPNARHLPHYGADSIYTLQAHRRGFRVVILPNAKVYLMDKHEPPTLKARAKEFKDGRLQFIRATFFRKKSKYYLMGQYWYHWYKYNFPVGPFLFLFKLLQWFLLTMRYVGQRQN